MKVSLFDFHLPEERIALRPAEPRGSAKLLVVEPGLADRHVADLPGFIRPGDVLVFNDTKVLPAQLEGLRERDGQMARISATLHMRAGPHQWKAFLRPAKRVKPGERIRFGGTGDACLLGVLYAEVTEKGEDGEALLSFELTGAALDEALHAVGHIPLPPYISAKRAEDARDRADYQTVFAREEGAVAAPTAGLHFTPELFSAIQARGASLQFVTLHVGAGTFLPVKAEDTKDHKMHAERGMVSQAAADALNAARAAGGRIIAIGTTSLRLLESSIGEDGRFRAWSGETSIFITPGYRFRTADWLMTNFHLPRSTLFMLVSAFSGTEAMRAAYAHAIASGYRFYSYGDACLLKRADLGQ